MKTKRELTTKSQNANERSWHLDIKDRNIQDKLIGRLYKRVHNNIKNKVYNEENSIIDKQLYFILSDIVTTFQNQYWNERENYNIDYPLEKIIEKFEYKKDSNQANLIREVGKLIYSLRMGYAFDLDNPESIDLIHLHLTKEFSDKTFQKITGKSNQHISYWIKPYFHARIKSLENLFSAEKEGLIKEELENFNNHAFYNGEKLRNDLAKYTTQSSDRSPKTVFRFELARKIIINSAILFGGLIVFGGAILLARAAYTKLRYGEFYSFGTRNVVLHYKHNLKAKQEAEEAANKLNDKTKISACFFKSVVESEDEAASSCAILPKIIDSNEAFSDSNNEINPTMRDLYSDQLTIEVPIRSKDSQSFQKSVSATIEKINFFIKDHLITLDQKARKIDNFYIADIVRNAYDSYLQKGLNVGETFILKITVEKTNDRIIFKLKDNGNGFSGRSKGERFGISTISYQDKSPEERFFNGKRHHIVFFGGKKECLKLLNKYLTTIDGELALKNRKEGGASIEIGLKI